MKNNYDVYLCREPKCAEKQMTSAQPIELNERNRENMMNSVELSYELVERPKESVDPVSELNLDFWVCRFVTIFCVLAVVAAWVYVF